MVLQSRNQGFTVIDLIAVIAIVTIGLALFLVLWQLGQPRGRNGRPMANMTQLRGIHMGFVTYAQSNKKGGNDGYFPGLDGSGHVVPDGEDTGYSGDGTQPGARMWMLLAGNFFTPDYMINPADPRAVEYEYSPTGEADPAHPVTARHYSYALLGLAELPRDEDDGLEAADDQRAMEWKETLNTSAIVMSDRGIGTGRADLSSVWTEPGRGDWRGGVTRNDNSTSFETNAEFEQTKYGNSLANELDHLFEDAPNATDAFLVFEDATTAYSAD